MEGGVSSARFVGRLDELARLHALLEGAAEGQPGALIVGGEAGVGKTRLVTEFAQGVRANGIKVLWGSCVESAGGGLPFGPVAAALRSVTEHDGAVVGGQQSRGRLFEAVRSTLERLGEEAPVVVVIDDLQWADDSTRDLLTYLLVNLDGVPVALVLTYRSDDLPRGDPLRRYLAELDRRSGVDRLDLRRFDREELFDQLTGISGAPPPAELADLIWEQSEGNPFFAEELFAAATSGDHDRDRRLPPTLHDILVARLGVVSEPAQRVLRAVAAGGVRVHHELLAAATGIADEELSERVREALAHQLLVADPESGTYSFRHALLREVAYEELLPGERTRLHAAYGRCLTERPELGGGATATAADRARHWYAAHDLDRALAASVEAGAVADGVYGFAEAQRHYERALDLWDGVAAAAASTGLDRTALLERAAASAHLAGDHRRACALIATAVDGVDPDAHPIRAAMLSERQGRYLATAGDSAAALVAYARAVRLVPAEPPSPERARVVGAQAEALLLVARYRESRACAEEAIAIARASEGARAYEGQALSTLGFDMALLGETDAGVALVQESLRIAEEVAHPDDVGRAYLNVCDLLSGPLNRVEEAVAIALRGVERARELGIARDYGAALEAAAANGLFRLGRWDEAEALLHRALARSPGGAAAIDLYLARGKLSVGRGRFEEAADDLRTASALSNRSVEPRYNAPLWTLRAGLAMWQGRLDEARSAYKEGLRHVRGTDDVWFAAPLIWHGLRAEADLAEQARARGDDGLLAAASVAGEALAQSMKAYTRAVPEPPTPSAAILLAYSALSDAELSRLRGGSDASAWGASAEAWDEVGQPYPAAYSRFRQAEALLHESAASPEGGRLLKAAHGVVAGMGAEPLRLEIDALAARARVVLDEPAEPVADARADAVVVDVGLTRREREVLALVARGQTNRQIATALFISEKTASVHVSNILAKLHAGSRVEAATIAHRLGLT